MCINEKESILGFSIMLGISLALYIRNGEYDKIIAALFVIISLIQLIEYLYHSKNITSENGGKLLHIILWLQLAVFGVGLYLHFKTIATAVWAIFFVMLLVGSILNIGNGTFSVTRERGHLVWNRKSSSYKNLSTSILGYFGVLYIIGLFGPFLIVQYYENWRNKKIWLILLSLLIATFSMRAFYPSINFASMWCYSAVGVIFTAWVAGAFGGCGPDVPCTPILKA